MNWYSEGQADHIGVVGPSFHAEVITKTVAFLGLVIAGMVAYCIESLAGVQGAVFIIAGLICFIPGAYHLGYVYLAVKGKRGFDFNQLPLFNN